MDGRIYNEYNKKQYRMMEVENHKDIIATLPKLNACQQKIYNYLDEDDGRRNILQLTKNKTKLQEYIATLPKTTQDCQNRILASIQEYPKVLYKPSEQGKTCRLSNCNDSAIGLKRLFGRYLVQDGVRLISYRANFVYSQKNLKHHYHKHYLQAVKVYGSILPKI